jgi:hypothetical protein
MAMKNSFRSYILDKLVKSFKEDSDDRLFMFIAKNDPWEDEDNPDSFSTSTDSVNNFYDVWNRMIAAKRIKGGDIYLMVDKNLWTSGTVYDEFTDDAGMSSKTYYVTTSEKNVYKCVHNNDGAKSISEPAGASTEVIETSDGYKWKFLFRIPASIHRYITDTEIPIFNLKIDTDQPDKYKDDRQLQYNAQLNAVNGSVENIKLTTVGGAYPASVIGVMSGANETRAQGGGASSITLSEFQSETDDYYNQYAIRIISGAGVGQIRTVSDYEGSTRTLTVSEAWTTQPDTTSYYEIMPGVATDGDGTGLVAIARVVDNATKLIRNIDVLDKGSGYTRATATIYTPNAAADAVLDPVISPYGGHGSDPIFELEPTKAMIITRLESVEGITSEFDQAFPGKNDYRQYGIVRNPIINTTYDGAGRVAGKEVDITVDVNIKSEDDDSFASDSYKSGDIVFGITSKTCGEVVNWGRDTDFTRGTARLRNVYGDFISNEKMINVTNLGSDVYSSASNKVAFFLFQEDPVLERSQNNYRLTTRLEVGPTGSGYGSKTFTDSSWAEDQIITGASGSTASLVAYTNTGVAGGTAELLLTSLVGASSAPEFGFTAGEILVGTTVDSIINRVEPPKFVKGSGDLLHLRNVTKIERHPEQEEELKIVINLS